MGVMVSVSEVDSRFAVDVNALEVMAESLYSGPIC